MADLTNALVAEKQPIAAARIQNLVEILLSRAEGEPTSVLMVLKTHFQRSLIDVPWVYFPALFMCPHTLGHIVNDIRVVMC